MVERSNDDTPRPLPSDWLPEAAPTESDPRWEFRAQRIVAAAEPSLRRLGDRPSVVDAWSTRLGAWWKPAAALATAAAALFVVLDPPGTREEFDHGSLPLSVVAAEGEPFVLWEAAGIDADPVLALIAMQEPAQ